MRRRRDHTESRLAFKAFGTVFSNEIRMNFDHKRCHAPHENTLLKSSFVAYAYAWPRYLSSSCSCFREMRGEASSGKNSDLATSLADR